jgi:hypothetical protein
MAKLKGKAGQQRVIVEHVHKGGQAIVGATMRRDCAEVEAGSARRGGRTGTTTVPPRACCGTAQAKPERKTRWRAAARLHQSWLRKRVAISSGQPELCNHVRAAEVTRCGPVQKRPPRPRAAGRRSEGGAQSCRASI